MKDSEIEWIGRVPKVWKIRPIRADFCEVTEKNKLGKVRNALKFTYGQIVPKDNFDSNIDNYVADKILSYIIVHPNTIMLNGLNLNFDFVSQRIGLVTEKGIITSAYLAFKAITPDVFPPYVTYLFKSYDNSKAFHNMGGGVRKILNFDELKKKYYLLPSFIEQQSIASYLDTKCSEIDALITDIQQQIDVLEQYKRSVITEAVAKGLNSDVEMRDSGVAWIGKIPNDWKMRKARYMFVQRFDKGNLIELRLLSPTQNYGVIPQWKYEELSGMVAVKLNEKADLMQFKTVHKGDYCISLRSFQGGFEYSEYEGVVSPAYQVFYPVVRIDDRYYKYMFKDRGFIEKMNSYAMTLRDGKNISFFDFGNTYIPYPPIEEQQSIAGYLDRKCSEIDSIIETKKHQLETLTEYKKSLIYEYVTGKKEV